MERGASKLLAPCWDAAILHSPFDSLLSSGMVNVAFSVISASYDPARRFNGENRDWWILMTMHSLHEGKASEKYDDCDWWEALIVSAVTTFGIWVEITLQLHPFDRQNWHGQSHVQLLFPFASLNFILTTRFTRLSDAQSDTAATLTNPTHDPATRYSSTT